MHAAGFVLVGGSSKRMGRDKALLRVGSASLVEHVALEVRAAAGSVALVGAPERYSALGFDCLPDLRTGFGPLAGIEAALGSRRGEWNLIVACDMPRLDSALLKQLLRDAEEHEAMCTVTRDAGGAIHPLCAVYRTSCAPVVWKALDTGRLRLMDVIRELAASIFEAEIILPNVNTPSEWEECQTTHTRITSNSGT